MLSIHTNLSSLISQNSLKTSTNRLNIAIERLATGYKINHAGDNAANYSIANDMESKISSYDIAAENVAMASDLAVTATDTLDLVQNHLTRIRRLMEMAANDTLGVNSRTAIQQEVDGRLTEINRIIDSCSYNDIRLFNAGILPSSAAMKVTDLGMGTGTFSVNKGGHDYEVDVDSTDTLFSLMTKMEVLGIKSEFNDTTGVFTADVNASAITDNGTGIKTLLGLIDTDGYNTSVLDEEMTRVVTEVANGETTLEQIGITNGSFTIVDSEGVETNDSIDLSSTLNQLFNKLSTTYSIGASIDGNGIISLDTSSGNYFKGALANGLGIIYTETSSTVYTGIAADSSNTLTHTVTAFADSTTKMSALGIGIGDTIQIKNNTGTDIWTRTADAAFLDTALGDVLSMLESNGIDSAGISDGVISLISSEHNYVTGTIAEKLGIGVESTGTGTTTGASQTSTSSVIYTETGIAGSGATMADLGIEIGDTIQIKNNSGTDIWTRTADAAFLSTTLGDVLSMLESNGIDSAGISGGVISLTSSEHNYVTGTIAEKFGIGIVTEGGASTVANAQTSSASLSYTTATIANTSTKMLDLGIAIGDVLQVKNNAGTTIWSVTADAAFLNTSLGDVLSTLTSNGMSTATVNNGVISMTSAVNNYVTGTVAEKLGIGVDTTTTYSTAGLTQTSSAGVTYTTTTLAGTGTTMGLMGIALGDTLQIKDNTGATIWSVTADAAFLNTTLGDVLSTLTSNGMSTATVNNGVISLTSAVNNYVAGTVADKLGIGVETTTTYSTAGLTQTSSSAVTYVTASVATTGTTFAELGISTSQAISVYDVNGNLKGTVTMTSGSTIGQMIASINAVNTSAGASISNGVITIGSGYITGSIADDMGLTYGATSTVPTSTTSIVKTIHSSVRITTTSGATATTSTKLSQLGIASGGYVLIKNSSGTSVKYNYSPSNTIQGFVNALKDYGLSASFISGTINISQTSSACIVEMNGELADKLKINGEVGYGKTWTCDKKTGISCTLKSSSSITYTVTNTPTNTTGSSGTVTAPTGFIGTVTAKVAQVTVTDAASLESAISTYKTIGIANADVLAALSTIVWAGTDCSGKIFLLTSDIDLSGYSSGEGWQEIGNEAHPFKGTFDGQGHVISNLTINQSGTYRQGLFGKVVNATIRNVGTENCNITAGFNSGGIVGQINGGSVSNCYVKGSINCTASRIGGICGSITTSSTQITNCYFIGTVIGHTDIGGIVGTTSGEIRNCLVYGTVTASYTSCNVGGIVGSLTGSNNSITSCKVKATVSCSSGAGKYVAKFIGQYGSSFTYNSFSILNSCVYDSSMTSPTKDIGSSYIVSYVMNTANASTTLSSLGVTGTNYVTVHSSATNSDITITVTNTMTCGNLVSSIKAATSNGITGTVVSGRVSLLQTTTDYIVGISDYLAKSIGFYVLNENITGVDKTWALGDNTIYSSSTSDTLNGSRMHTLAAGSTLGDIGLSSASFVMNDGTTVNLTSTSTIRSVFTNAGLTANVSNGTITVTGDSSHYITSMSENLRTALHINTGAGYTYTITSNTTHSNTNSNTQSVTTTCTLANLTTLGNLGLNSASFVMSNGTTVNLTSTSTILNAFTGAGLTASISNGTITVTGSSSNYITSMSSNLKTALKINAGAGYTYTITSNTTHSNTDSNPHTVTTVTTLSTSNSGSITLAQLGLSSASNIVTNNSTINVLTTDSVSQLITKLEGAGLTGTILGGQLTIDGDSSHYILSMSDGLKNTLKIRVGEGYTYNVIGGTTHSNTNSDTQMVDTTYSISNTTTLGKLNLSSASFVMNDGTTVNLTTTSTILNAFTGAGLTASIAGGRLTVTGDSSHYITSMSENLKSALKINAGEGYTYNVIGGVIHSNTNSETQRVSTTTTLSSSNSSTLSMADLGLTSNANIITNNSTINILTTDMMSEVLTKLSNTGIAASINDSPAGTLHLVGNISNYIVSASNNLKTLLGLNVGNGYTYNTASGSITRSDSDSRAQNRTYNQTYTQTATENSLLSKLYNSSPAVEGVLLFSTGDGNKTVSIASNETIKSLCGKLSDAGIVSSFTGGKLIIAGNNGDTSLVDYGSGTTSQLASLIGLNYESSLDNFCMSSDINAIADAQYNSTVNVPSALNIQVGIHGNSSDVVSIDTNLALGRVTFDTSSSDAASSALAKIDTILDKVSQKQTDYAAFSNRLESAAESIAISMDNLISSLSTIKDVDIAKVSSQYLQYQILQNAAMTLLATANQTPAIALQLI